jgi:small subunit ribosomal protein S14
LDRKLYLLILLRPLRTQGIPVKIKDCVKKTEKGNCMAKKSMIARERKREKLVAQYAEKRSALLEEFRKADDPGEKFELHRKIQRLPRASSRTRLRNRCWKTGRPRGYYRDFGLCRNQLREMAHQGLLPGVVKSSW